MNSLELAEARYHMKRKESEKDPEMKRLFEEQDRRAKEERRRQDILNSCGPNGYRCDPLEQREPQKSDRELQMDSILKHY